MNQNNLDLTSFESYESSVLEKIKETLKKHFGDLKNVELSQIKNDEKIINIYSNYKDIEPISKEEIIIK